MDTFLTQLSSTVSTRALASTAPEPALTPASPTSDRIGRFLHVVIEPRSYLNALYMLIAFPLGLTYFLVLVGGAITGAFTGIILVGLLFLLATLAAAWGFALLERELVIVLLGVDVPPHSLPDTELVSPWRMLVRHLRQPTTWRSMVYLLIRLPFGIFATLLAGILLGPSLTGIIFPIGRLMSEGPSPLAIGNLIVPGAPAVVGLAISFHILNAVGRTWGRFAADMLGVSEEQRQVWESRRRAEVADRSRRELIMNVSHELRTPIASIQAHVDSLLLPEADRPDAEETERRLRVTAADAPAVGPHRGPPDAGQGRLARAEGRQPPGRRGPHRRADGPGAGAIGAQRTAGHREAGRPARRHLGHRRSRPARAGADQPCAQRDQLHAGGWRRLDPPDQQRRPRPDRGRRHWTRNVGRRPRAHLRALLPRRQLAHAQHRRFRARTVDRARARGRDGRQPFRELSARTRQHVLDQPAPGRTELANGDGPHCGRRGRSLRPGPVPPGKGRTPSP